MVSFYSGYKQLVQLVKLLTDFIVFSELTANPSIYSDGIKKDRDFDLAFIRCQKVENCLPNHLLMLSVDRVAYLLKSLAVD